MSKALIRRRRALHADTDGVCPRARVLTAAGPRCALDAQRLGEIALESIRPPNSAIQ